jgi:hypothetical protein
MIPLKFSSMDEYFHILGHIFKYRRKKDTGYLFIFLIYAYVSLSCNSGEMPDRRGYRRVVRQ